MPSMKKEKKARSKSQQRLFGMVTAYKSGKLKLDDLPPSLSKKIKSIADGKKRKTGDKRRKTKGVTKKAAKEMAETKHKGLPETVKETYIKRLSNVLNEDKNDDNYMDALKGGEAENMTIEDIAKKHNVPIGYIEMIMPDAIEIELEHTDDASVAARIALDHLWETPLYYNEEKGLPNMEEELEDLDEEELEEIVVKKYNAELDELDEEELEEKEEELDKEIIKRVKKFNEMEDDLEEIKESVNTKNSEIREQINKLLDVIRFAKTRAEAEELQDEVDELEELLAEEGEPHNESSEKK